MSSPAATSKRQQVAVWFEIPVSDLDRASVFYQKLFDAPLKRENFGPMEIAVFPYLAEGGAAGCLAYGLSMKASSAGSLIYLNADPSLDTVLRRATAAGGRVVQPHIALPPGMGFFAHIEDTEGNRVGLHALEE